MNRRLSLAERRRIYEIVEIGAAGDVLSRAYDLLYTLTIILNLAATILGTFDSISGKYSLVLDLVEFVTVTAFAADYVMRIYTADFHYRDLGRAKAALRFAMSFGGIIDLISFLPVYLPFFFPSGAAALRLVRVIRIFRLFRINSYYDSLNVIASVLQSKKNQLISSVSIILVLMLASSLCMYSLEHETQPEVFSNAFSGIWWAASTLLTVGYGDIYPVTTLGRILGILITFLGVGAVAIPTGIISAGFVEQDTRFRQLSEQANEYALRFIKVQLHKNDEWADRPIRALGLPAGVVIAAIQRQKQVVVPKGDTVLQDGDVLVIGTEHFQGDWSIELKEVELRRQSPWVGQAIRDLDISRQTIVVLVKRHGTMLAPRGSTVLREGDQVLLYTKSHISGAVSVKI